MTIVTTNTGAGVTVATGGAGGAGTAATFGGLTNVPLGTLQHDQTGALRVNTGNAWLPITSGSTVSTVGNGTIIDRTVMWDPAVKHAEILDKFELNQVVVEHKVAEHELMKLKADQPDYAEHIKQNLAKTATTQILNKMSFTKKRNIDTDVNHFIGRVWVFNKDEMETLIKEIRNA